MPKPLDALFLLLQLFFIFLVISFLINLAYKLKASGFKMRKANRTHSPKRINSQKDYQKNSKNTNGYDEIKTKPTIPLKMTVIPPDKLKGVKRKRLNR